jgi:hypothetical protein
MTEITPTSVTQKIAQSTTPNAPPPTARASENIIVKNRTHKLAIALSPQLLVGQGDDDRLRGGLMGIQVGHDHAANDASGDKETDHKSRELNAVLARLENNFLGFARDVCADLLAPQFVRVVG